MVVDKKFTKKQLLQQRAIDNRKILNRFKRKNKTSALPVSKEMIQEASIRSSLDRLRSILPAKRTPKPNPMKKEAKIRPTEIPYFSNIPVPWLNGDGSFTLSDELAMFARYVSVRQKHFDDFRYHYYFSLMMLSMTLEAW
jgi:hypothetical protein